MSHLFSTKLSAISLLATSATVSPLINLQQSLQSLNRSFTVKLQSWDNYTAWWLQLKPMLTIFKIAGIVYGSKPPPVRFLSSTSDASPEPNPALDVWQQKDQMVLSQILSSVAKDIFPILQGANAVATALNALLQGYGTLSYVQQTQLVMELDNLQKGDLCVSSHLHKAKVLLTLFSLLVIKIPWRNSMPLFLRSMGISSIEQPNIQLSALLVQSPPLVLEPQASCSGRSQRGGRRSQFTGHGGGQCCYSSLTLVEDEQIEVMNPSGGSNDVVLKNNL
ncbi:OLC1v1005503C1 [Oldenlandia corymbosa var. corymbosa]|uniref:OLC1v1005503C1 n=1 Tax=Oldenlandia corymbosa var. corymbosa TaxID=529605 RepID=A0AAV1DH48_OLDCO|nr:OLC1v1005503C1 [Oldenlandia corymbosa var. corymbosa]